MANLRKSATLIILAKDNTLLKHGFDYKVLLFNRHEKSSFMPNTSVFPGGVHEAADSSPLWLKHFQSFGVKEEKLKELTLIKGARPSVFTLEDTKDGLLREVSMRITAIRETFEEVGILLCRREDEIQKSNGYAQKLDNFDRERWQQVVHNDPTKFITLCEELKVMPDLWNLYEWSAWRTPSTFKKRFDAAFYLAALETTPQVLMEKNEVQNFAWKTPLEYLLAFSKKEHYLAPPQFYELSRLLNYKELDALKDFASRRMDFGVNRLAPVQYKCTNGGVALLNDDDMYPCDPNASDKMIPTNKSIEDFREGSKKVHRIEFRSPYSGFLQLNFTPTDGQLTPLDYRKFEANL